MINAQSWDALCEGRSGQRKSKSDAAACEQRKREEGGVHAPLSKGVNKLLSAPVCHVNTTEGGVKRIPKCPRALGFSGSNS